MAKKEIDKLPGPTKSFMTIGPTLHYSHSNVIRCWMMAVGVYFGAALFWSKILTGTAFSADFNGVLEPAGWRLGQFVVSPLSIYEYPWQILVLGLLMGVLSVTPVLISQLMSFRYSLLMIIGVIVVAKLPMFGVFLILSCAAVACRPLRFRSRFIAIVLCMAPQLAYWAVFGGDQGSEPIQWSLSLTPWISAWFIGVAMAGAVLGIGHFTRYRPGLVWSISLVVVLTSVLVFQRKISFAELDYQLYVAGNNPEEVEEFYQHPMGKIIDEAMVDPDIQRFLAIGFYSSDKAVLREELKNDIRTQLSLNRWPLWFKPPEKLEYQKKRRYLLDKYERFISKRAMSKRMPIALYYKAMLNEYQPDLRFFGQQESLRFYNDYPHVETLPIWHKLYEEFPQSAESLEARWRFATHLAGRGEFARAQEVCEVALVLLDNKLKELQKADVEEGVILTAFTKPDDTVMTVFKLNKLKRKLQKLELLISEQNLIADDQESANRLARFVILNPYSKDYTLKLDELLGQTEEDDPLRDNILLEKIMLIADSGLRQQQLNGLFEKFKDTDGGVQGLYELGMLNVQLWKDPQNSTKEKEKYLSRSRAILSSFVDLYPDSIFSEQAEMVLRSLPE